MKFAHKNTQQPFSIGCSWYTTCAFLTAIWLDYVERDCNQILGLQDPLIYVDCMFHLWGYKDLTRQESGKCIYRVIVILLTEK